MRAAAKAVVAALLVVQTLIVVATNVGAACWPGRPDSPYSTHFHAGWYRYAPGIWGAKANIREYNDYVSTPPNINTYGEVGALGVVGMADGSPVTGSSVYAEAGWIQLPGGSRYMLANRCLATISCPERHLFAAQPIDQSTEYQVQLHTADGTFWYYANQTAYFSVSAGNPSLSYVWSYGETHNEADQMPGDTGTGPMYMDYVAIGQNSCTPGWLDINGSSICGSSSATITNSNGSWYMSQPVWDPAHHINVEDYDSTC